MTTTSTAAAVQRRPSGADWAKLERNLERFPMFPLDKGSRKEVRYSDSEGREWICSTERDELPGAFGNDLWVAIGKLYNDQRCTAQNRTVRTTRAELLRLAGVPKGGKTYASLLEVLDSFQAVYFRTAGTFRNRDGTFRRTERFGLVQNVAVIQREKGQTGEDGSDEGVDDDFRIEITLSAEIAESIESGVFRLLDTVTYRALDGATPRRLFRYLDARRRIGRDQVLYRIEVPLRELRNHLPLDPVSPSLVMRTLAKAHENLKEHGVLKSARFVRAENGDRSIDSWTVEYEFARAKQQELSLDVPAEAAGPAELPPGDLTRRVHAIVEILGDSENAAWYAQISKSLSESVVEGLLAEARELQKARVMTPSQIRRAFSQRAKQRAAEIGVEL